jgi:hypothetical protein
VQKYKVRNVIWIKYRDLDVKWLLKIGSYSKPRMELEFLWSSGGSCNTPCNGYANYLQ